MNIGNRIKKRRIELGLSVDEVAERLGKNRATVYRYENNDIENLPTTVLEPLARILDTTPAFLMGWAEKEECFCEMTTFEDEIEDYIQEIGEFLYYNQKHKVLFDSVMNVKPADVELAQQMLDRINGLHIIPLSQELNAAHARTDIELPQGTDTSDNDIMDDENF